MIKDKKILILVFALISIINYLPAYAQNKKIVFPSTNLTVGEAIKEIEKQTDYLISYSTERTNLNQPINLTDSNLPLEAALEQILKPTKATTNIRGNHILIISETQISPNQPEDKPTMENLPETTPIITHEDDIIDIRKLETELINRKQNQEVKQPATPTLVIETYKQEPAYIALNPEYTDYLKALPKYAIRTNLLYGLGTFTLNLGIETGLNPRSTLLFTGSYNYWKTGNYEETNKKLWHWIVGAEYRYWLCQRFNGHFLGTHAFFSKYNISGKKVPFVFEKGSENYRYEGVGLGAGISYGYQFMLTQHWNLELNAGIGIGWLKYDKSDCLHCGESIEKDASHTFVAPTKLGVSLIYAF